MPVNVYRGRCLWTTVEGGIVAVCYLPFGYNWTNLPEERKRYRNGKIINFWGVDVMQFWFIMREFVLQRIQNRV